VDILERRLDRNICFKVQGSGKNSSAGPQGEGQMEEEEMVVATDAQVQEKPSYIRTDRMVERAVDVIAVLVVAGGSLKDDKGKAMRRLLSSMRKPVFGPNALALLTNMVKEMEDHGVVEREIHGRRTKAIKLLAVPDDLEKAVKEEVEVRGKTPRRRLSVVQETAEEFTIEDAGVGIFEILNRFQDSLERLGDQTSGRLAEVLEENQRLRDALHELQEDFAAKSHKVETLTKQTVILQGNLDAAMKRDTTGMASAKAHRMWEQMMTGKS
jgi:hypothetical protein